MTHSLTILTSADRPPKRAAKMFRLLSTGAVESVPYDKGAKTWRVERRPVDSFDDLVAQIVPLQDHPHSIVILGQPKDGVDLSQPVLRRSRETSAAFEDSGTRLLPLDLDSLRADHLDVIGDPGGAIQFAIDTVAEFAPELEGASCLAIFSSSAGVKDNTTAKLRLWYWLAKAYAVADLKRWAKQVNERWAASSPERAKSPLVDPEIFKTVQPIYVARPSFEGLPDPLPGVRRWAVVDGYTDAVELVIGADAPRPTYSRTNSDGTRVLFGGGVERHLAEIGGVAGIYGPSKSAVGAFVAKHGAEKAEREAGAFIARVADIIRSVDPGGRSAADIQQRIDNLDGLMAWTIDQQRNGEAAKVSEIIPDTRPRLLLEEGRKALREMVAATAKALLAIGWDADTSEDPAPAAQIGASLGLGKTEASGQTALDLVDAVDLVEAGISPIAMAAPTHKLNAEVRERVRTMAARRGSKAKVAMALGREAIDPDGDGKATMCSRVEDVREVQRAGVTDIQSHMCRRVVVATDAEGRKVRTEHLCPDFNGCRYQDNYEEVKAADIVLVAHAALGHVGAKTYRFVLVDENPVPAMLRGCDGNEDQPHGWITVTPADLSHQVLNRMGAVSRDKTAELEIDHPALVECRLKMAELQRINGRGYVRRAALVECRFTAEQLREARKSAYNLQQKALKDLVPGMDRGQRRELLKRFAKNTALRNEATLYGLLADFLDREDLGAASGWVRWTTKTVEKQRHDVWRLTYLGKISAQYNAPTIYLDATMREDYRFALRALSPGLRDDLGGEVLAASPHRKVRVVRSTAWTLNQMRDDPEARAREAQAYMLREVTALGGGQAVAVTNKAVAVAMAAAPVEGIDAVHFAVVRGLDRWRLARYQATLGRPQPRPKAVETMAAAITGKAVEPVDGWYPTVERPILGRGGKVLGGQRVPQHPDPLAEACRWQIAEAALIQSERLRGVERTAETPALWDLVGCPVPDGIEVDEVIDYREPSTADLMLAVGGAVLGNPAHAVRLYPELWPVVPKDGETVAVAEARTINAAKQAAKREGSWVHSLNRGSIKEMYPTSVRYTLQGRGQKPAEALVLPHALPGFRAALEARLGPLAVFEIEPEVRRDQEIPPVPALPSYDTVETWLASLPPEERAGIPIPLAEEADPAAIGAAVVYLGEVLANLDRRLNVPIPPLTGALDVVTVTTSSTALGPPDF